MLVSMHPEELRETMEALGCTTQSALAAAIAFAAGWIVLKLLGLLSSVFGPRAREVWRYLEARFYDHLNDLLIEGAKAALDEQGHRYEVVTVPGALEIPGAVAMAAETGRYDGFVAIGVVIRGETYHFEVVSNESARGLMALSMDGIAIGNGILTVENEEQALVRARPDQKDKGGEAAKAAIAMLALRDRFGA